MSQIKMFNLKRFAALFFVLSIIVGQSSCWFAGEIIRNRAASRDEKQLTSRSSDNPKPAKGEIINNDRPFADLEREILSDFEHENFDAIDQKAVKARRDKERLTGAYWKLRIIYEPLTGIFTDQSVTDEMWTAHLDKLKRWKEKSPQSITARVALGQSYIGYAWFARGSGYSNTVADRDHDAMRERLDIASAELIEAQKLSEKCPQWHESMLFLAMAQSWDAEEYDKLFEEAVNFEPNYYYFYYQKGTNSLPRWSGRKGDWEKFAKELENLDSKEKNIIYFLYVSNMVDNYYDEWVDHQSISWERAKKGYKELEAIYGTDKQRLSQYAFLASANEDMPEAYHAFKTIGDDFDSEVWSKKRFDEVKTWAIARYEAENGK